MDQRIAYLNRVPVEVWAACWVLCTVRHVAKSRPYALEIRAIVIQEADVVRRAAGILGCGGDTLGRWPKGGCRDDADEREGKSKEDIYIQLLSVQRHYEAREGLLRAVLALLATCV
ncbi:hypothetical protein B0H14DRAFT_2563049 [Mycena olivaceomarginata]|nr:hypothetical protein B0H14DRAFT_2563049 [Mycena olivaceomarginata]